MLRKCKYVTTSFVGNHKAQNYPDMVANLVQSYKAMECNMPKKVHFLDSLKTSSQKNLGQWAMSTAGDFTKIFPPWKSGTKASGDTHYVGWLLPDT